MSAGNIHELGQSGAGAGAYLDRVVAFFSHEFVDGHGAADDHVGFKFDAHFAHVVELLADDLLGQRNSGMP